VIVPAGTPEDDSLYLTGPFNQWNPADSQYQFNSEGDGLYRLVLSVDEGEHIEYRITRGSFINAEKLNPEDRFANREVTVPAGEESMLVVIEIQGWWDD
jgi:1,4-alpha-glucan branching enzyme